MGIAPADTKWVYDFAEGSKEMRNLLGGKGANVAEMTRILGADRVPAGFTITTEACVAYMKHGQSVPDGMDAQVDEALARLEAAAGTSASGAPSAPVMNVCASSPSTKPVASQALHTTPPAAPENAAR